MSLVICGPLSTFIATPFSIPCSVNMLRAILELKSTCVPESILFNGICLFFLFPALCVICVFLCMKGSAVQPGFLQLNSSFMKRQRSHYLCGLLSSSTIILHELWTVTRATSGLESWCSHKHEPTHSSDQVGAEELTDVPSPLGAKTSCLNKTCFTLPDSLDLLQFSFIMPCELIAVCIRCSVFLRAVCLAHSSSSYS